MAPEPIGQTSSTPAQQVAIQVSQLEYTYPGGAQPVLNIPHWQVTRGQRLFLYGPSGAGKSTLLNLLAGIIKPRSGTIELLGQPVSDFKSRARDRFRAAHIGIVFQQFNLIPYLSVLDNIRLAAHFCPTRQKDVAGRAHQLVAQLGLPDSILARPAHSLSIGQQQRVAIARALINHPEILIVDEPTSALDAAVKDAFIELLLNLVNANQSTLVFVSHDQSLAQNFDESLDLTQLNTVVAHSHAV